MSRIALVGDYDPKVTAHRAIPLALERAARVTGTPVTWDWIGTPELVDGAASRLDDYVGIWLVPGGPYASTEGALGAIRCARESRRPYLGSCAGFQHAVLEYARNVWGIPGAAHAELDPAAPDPVIARLSCSLVEVKGTIRPVAGTRLAAWYGIDEVTEGYHCNYGVSPDWAERLDEPPLTVAARDTAGAIRAIELQCHPFFVATLYQPERSALAGHDHPLIQAFVRATTP